MTTITTPAATCPVPLGGRKGPACGKPAPHKVINWRRRSNADQRYSVCCDHAPGPPHSAGTCTGHYAGENDSPEEQP